jgi:hypothetical protein
LLQDLVGFEVVLGFEEVEPGQVGGRVGGHGL